MKKGLLIAFDPLEKVIATHSSILAWRISMDRAAWWATVREVTELDMTERLSIAQQMLSDFEFFKV